MRVSMMAQWETGVNLSLFLRLEWQERPSSYKLSFSLPMYSVTHACAFSSGGHRSVSGLCYVMDTAARAL